MIQLSDFKPGQEVIITEDRYFSDWHKATVEKVGRKYVTLAGVWQRQFYVGYADDALVEKIDYGTACLLFPTEEAYQKARDRAMLKKKLRQVFDWSNIDKLSCEQLKQVDAIVEGSPVKET